MKRIAFAAGVICLLSLSSAWAAGAPLVDTAKTGFGDFAPLPKGWVVARGGLTGESPEYYSLPQTARGDFADDSWSYHTVFPVALWRTALAGQPDWADYTVDCVLRIEKPAPLRGFRGGETFFNYQWGREAIGSDAAIIVRSKGPDDCYMVRVSSGYGHVELWKTHGGVVQVQPFTFEAGKPYHLAVTASGPWIIVAVEGKEVIRYCDQVEPILAGRVGVGVRESRTAFTDFKVTPAATIHDAPPVHKADFHVRQWVGKKYIFDGDEPIAWIYPNAGEGLELREVKLMPGLMPLVMPVIGVASFDYQPNGGTLNITSEGASLAFTADQKSKDGAFNCLSQWTLTYAAGKGYAWDKKVHFTAMKDHAQTEFEIDDPYFYQMVAPATDKLPKERTIPNYSILERYDGKLIAFPNAHHMWTDGLGDSNKEIVRPDGSSVTVVDGWGVAAELPADNAQHFTVGYCHWGLDEHLRSNDKPVATKGTVWDGHLVYSLWDRARVKEALAKGAPPTPAKPNPAELFANVEPVNHFAELHPGLSGDSVRLWTGNYTVDHAVGHNDHISMRINAADIKDRTDNTWGDQRPNVWQGSSYWMGPYLGKRYKIGMWVKADQFTGKVAIIADGIARPKPNLTKEYHAELPINGKCDWTYVGFETEMPRNAYSWVLRIDPVGQGVIWVDDVEISPVDGK